MDELQFLRSKSCLPGRKLPPVPAVVASPTSFSNGKKFNRDKCQHVLFQEYAIFQEYLLVQKAEIVGLYVIPSHNSSFVWNGVLFARSGVYCGGVFRFQLILPCSFPSEECPTVVFKTPVYHPLIHPETGFFDVQRYLNLWRPGTHHVWHILIYLRKIFTNVECSSPQNSEAADDFANHTAIFKSKVQQCIQHDKDLLYQDPSNWDEDDSAIRFTELSSELYAATKQDILESLRDPAEEKLQASLPPSEE